MSRQIVLNVRSGFHVGARAPLAKDRDTVLGRAAECGLVLADASVADRHLAFRTDGRHLIVTALDAPVEVPGRGRVEPGFRTRLSKDTMLKAGDVSLKAEVPSGHARSFAIGIGIPAVVALAGLVGAVMPKAPNVAAPALDIAATEKAAVPEAPPVATPPPAAPAPEPTVIDRAALADRVRMRLTDLGFEGMTLAADRESLALSGRVSTDRKRDFQGFQAWFDDAHPDLVLRTSDVVFVAEAPEEARPPAIESVWNFGTPYVVIAGKRYHGGDTVPNGWRLDRVEEDRAVFSHGGQTYRVVLGATGDDAPPPDARIAAR